ncbi:hypothetical protein HK105_205551 [Polyrhizophydium stewartii]|uniref:Uncharacterized protein n=1 Tax=Polyrhizophydium stewartii TaxID=2732419 RepID=A0ABR4N631_9FUNG
MHSEAQTPDMSESAEVPPAASEQQLHTLVLSLSQGLESMRRQLHEQQAAGEALRADNGALRQEVVQLQARVATLESLASAPHAAPAAAAPAAATPAHPAVVMPPMRFNADAANLWDRLPDDVRSKIIDLAGDLTKFINGLMHPLEIDRMHSHRQKRMWHEALECDFQGDLRSLPGSFMIFNQHNIRSRGMLARLQELGWVDHRYATLTALVNRWDDCVDWDDSATVTFAAACSGQIDILSDMLKTRRHHVNLDLAFAALAFCEFRTAEWLIDWYAYTHPRAKIPFFLRDKSVRDMLAEPPCNFDVHRMRVISLTGSEKQVREELARSAQNPDAASLDIMFARFRRTIDITNAGYKLGTVSMAKWAHKHKAQKWPAHFLNWIVDGSSNLEATDWACRELRLQYVHDHLLRSCISNNGSMVAHLVRVPGLSIDSDIIWHSFKRCSPDAIIALVEFMPSLASAFVEIATGFCQSNHYIMDGYANHREMVKWLYSRYPWAFKPQVLPPAINAALTDNYFKTVEFLLNEVTTVEWDCDAARSQVADSKGSLEDKRSLLSLIIPYGIRRTQMQVE